MKKFFRFVIITGISAFLFIGGYRLFKILDDPGKVPGYTKDTIDKELDDTIELEHSRIPDSSDIKSYFESEKRIAELKEIELLERSGTRIVDMSDTVYLKAKFKGVDAAIDKRCRDSISGYYNFK